MTAVARIATDRVPDVVVVPAEAIFQQDGAPSVYVLEGSEFVQTQVEVKRRGREQAIIASGVEPGDRIATRRPAPAMVRRAD
jgi:multidrug efflux pump subunit AcrA (membrane-fusion protein)